MISRAVRMHLISLKRGSGPADAHLEGREELGGKAQGLLALSQVLTEMNAADYPWKLTSISQLHVSARYQYFDAFMLRSGLDQIDFSHFSDARIAHAFQRADLPFEILGELHALINRWSIRWQSGLRAAGRYHASPVRWCVWHQDDPQYRIPNQDIRFQKLVEAIKFVWASTYFKICQGLLPGDRTGYRGRKNGCDHPANHREASQRSLLPGAFGCGTLFQLLPVETGPARRWRCQPGAGYGQNHCGWGKILDLLPGLPSYATAVRVNR
jgi:hypothetical protein